MTLSRLPSSRDDYVSCRTTEPQRSRKTYHRATRVPVANSFCSWPLLAKHGIANRAYAQTHTDTDTLSHIWETYVPNVYAFSLHEYKPGVHGNIYIHCADRRCTWERGKGHPTPRCTERTVIQDTRYVCARLQHTVNVRWYRSLWHNKSEGAEYNAASCAQWPPWKLWNVPPILPSHSIQPGEDSRGVRRCKHFSRLLILKISESVRDDHS